MHVYTHIFQSEVFRTLSFQAQVAADELKQESSGNIHLWQWDDRDMGGMKKGTKKGIIC